MVGRHIVTCKSCGKKKEQPKSTKGKYCSIQCQQDDALMIRIAKWTSGGAIFSNRVLKRMLALARGYSCESCGISKWNSKSIVLEVEHRDGNSSNCDPENVCLICPNCHSQTPTYKGANRGSGRYYRRIRYAEGKSY